MWASFFGDYYGSTGSWIGVEAVVASLPASDMSPVHGPGHGRGPMMGMMQSWDGRLLLAAADGRIVFDSAGGDVGLALDAADLMRGTPIISRGQRVGTLVLSQAGVDSGPALEFLGALNRGILLAAVAAGFMALVLGTVFVRQITAPLHRLQSVANAIASGDLSQRVAVSSQDDLGDVASSFNQMAESLERNETLRRHMMADIAHELRTPLTVMQGQVEALLDGVFPLELEHLTPIHDQTILLSRLVTDLRDLALAEAGNLKLERRPTDLGELAQRVAAAVEPAAAEKDIRLVVEVTPGLPAVSADADRLRQVFHNLLSNALRHTPAGGKIEVVVDGIADSGSVRPVAVEHGASPGPFDWLGATVTDTGSGIAPADLPYVFDRFYRAESGRSGEDSGSGLGLTIARSIIEAHGGRIWAASQPGQGSRITFSVPVASQDGTAAV
jgi:two-component system OmpR family sensor kinase/two-component system sensor histidine kinase BaeS